MGLKQTLADASGIGEIGEISEAATPHDALDFVRRRPWDAVILDIGLPGRGGLDVLKDIKQEAPRLPVLILSMHARRAIRRTGYPCRRGRLPHQRGCPGECSSMRFAESYPAAGTSPRSLLNAWRPS